MNQVESITTFGNCYCGSVRFHAARAPRSVVHCHCGQCRRLSGAAFTTWATFAKESFGVSGSESLSIFQVSDNVTRHFCKVCGSHVYSSDKRLPKVVGVPAGAVAGTAQLIPSAHYFVSDKASWHENTDALPRFGGESGGERLVIAHSLQPDDPTAIC